MVSQVTRHWRIVLALGLAACAGILGLRKAGPQPFPHRAHVLKGVSCVKCHVGLEGATDDGPLHLPTSESCLECHPKPHDTRPCLECHTDPFAAPRAEMANRFLRFEHKVHVPVFKGDCARCHINIRSATPTTLLPKMATCLACHTHEDEFRTRECRRCHHDLETEEVRPESHVIHDGDFFRGHGLHAAASRDLCSACHSQRFCATCHGTTVPALKAAIRFDDPSRTAIHRAGFRSRHAEESRREPGMCTTCHDQSFCVSCHTAERVGPATAPGSPHPPGWTGTTNDHGPAARRDPVACAACHGGAGEMLCVECHKVGGIGGSPHGPGYSSNRSMTDLPCRLCHTNGR